MIKIIIAIVKERWTQAINDCLNQSSYGRLDECKLCSTSGMTHDKRAGRSRSNCNNCICLPYARTHPWWCDEIYEPLLGEYCGNIVETERINKGDLFPFNNVNVRHHLRLMGKWLEKNF